MGKLLTSFNLLLSNATDYLTSKLGYQGRSLERHTGNWRRVREFMEANHIKNYNPNVEKKALFYLFKNEGLKVFTRHQKELYNSIVMLTEFQVTGKIKVGPRIDRRHFDFNGSVGKVMTGFIEYKRIEQRLSQVRILCYKRYLFRFLQYCNENGIRTIDKIDLPFIFHFIAELDVRRGTPVNTIISSLRGFIKYAFEQKFLTVDYSLKIPQCKSINQPRLPSTYSKQEIEKLISAVDRSSASGKRNYAIILIAARLGLRASDICRLKFDSIKWDTNTIEIKQVKTGRELVLPLLPDVGNAIIDYLKYARPESEESYIFLTERPPFEPFSNSNIVTHIVQRAFIKAGINIKDRKFGPHSLRHSLSFRMLEQSTLLPVISEVLGHENTESTRYYLRIDLQSMKQCMLDVPVITPSFYKQKKGGFYA